MRFGLKAVVTWILLVGAWPVLPAVAQELTPERVQYALDRTDDRIELAQTVVASVDNPLAQVELDAAIRLQADARVAFGSGQLRLAMDLTLRARARADRAISLVKGLPDPDRVLAQLERTRELIESTRDRIEECDNPRARALLRVAVEMQGRAEAAFRESRYLAALQLTLGARDRVHRALRLCRVEDTLENSAERALARTDEILAQSSSEAARAALARAVSLQGEAYVEFRAQHFQVSIRLTMSARSFAYRALRLAKS